MASKLRGWGVVGGVALVGVLAVGGVASGAATPSNRLGFQGPAGPRSGQVNIEFTGFAEAAFATVTVYDRLPLRDVAVCTATVNAAGRWKCVAAPGGLPQPLRPTTHAFVVKPADASLGIESFAMQLAIESALNAPTAAGTEPRSQSHRLVFRGTTTPSRVVTVFGPDEEPVCRTTAESDGRWECLSAVRASDGLLQFEAHAEYPEAVFPAYDAGPIDAGPDAGPRDAGPVVDAGVRDAGSVVDAGPRDAGFRDAGLVVDAGPPIDAGPIDGGPAAFGTGIAFTVRVESTTETIATFTSPRDGALLSDGGQDLVGNTTTDGGRLVVELDGQPCTGLVRTATGFRCPRGALPPLQEGVHEAKASAVGVTELPGSPDRLEFVVDTTAPAAPTFLLEASTTLRGGDVSIRGAAEPLSQVAVQLDGAALCSTTSDAVGRFECFASGLADGAHTLSAVARDGANNASASTSLALQVDGSAPFEPTLLFPVSGQQLAAGKLFVVGMAEPGTTVEVSSGATTCSATPDDFTGQWSCELSPRPSAPSTTLRVVGKVGNRSSATQLLQVDASSTSHPLPALTRTLPSTLPAQIGLSGTAAPGALVELQLDGRRTTRLTADPRGNWVSPLGSALSHGGHVLAVRELRGERPVGTGVSRFAATDLSTPPAPRLVVPAGDEVGVPTNELLAGAEVKGLAQPRARVDVTVDGRSGCSATVADDGTFACTPATSPTPGLHVFTAWVTDGAGLVSPIGTGVGRVVAARTPGPRFDAPFAAIGTLPFDVAGSGRASTPLELRIRPTSGSTIVRTVQVDAAGRWTTSITSLANGDAVLTATQEGVAEQALRRVDLIAPQAPRITLPADGSTVRELFVVGSAEQFARVEVQLGGVKVCEVATDVTGHFSCAPTGVSAGATSISAIARDVLGRSSTATTSQVVVDGTSPLPAPDVRLANGSAADGSLGHDGSHFDIASRVDAARASIHREPEGTELCNVALTNGQGGCDLDSFPPGRHTLTVVAFDAAGRPGNAASVSFFVATPVFPTTSTTGGRSSSSSASSSSTGSTASSTTTASSSSSASSGSGSGSGSTSSGSTASSSAAASSSGSGSGTTTASSTAASSTTGGDDEEPPVDPGCGCTGAGNGLELFGLLAAAGLLRRSRRA